MRSLYLRIWLTVVAALALFALVSGWLVQRHLEEQRERNERIVQERVAAWADLLQSTLPAADAPVAEQARALEEWALKLRRPLALDAPDGSRIAVTEAFLRRGLDRPEARERLRAVRLDDGRTLWVPQPRARIVLKGMGPPLSQPPGWLPGGRGPWPDGLGLVALLAVLFAAVAAGAWPVVRRLTRRLEALQAGVEAFGAGQLNRRVDEGGRDEVAAVAGSFNRAAARIEALLRSHQNLLANASHELRSPLARLKMAMALLDEAPPAERARLKREIDANIAELDTLVEEVLLASRLDAQTTVDTAQPVALLALAVEEAARVGASAEGDDLLLRGDERLLRRALRNLLENARRYAGAGVELRVARRADGGAELTVADRGPGVPEALRERIFEPFFRMPGHAEREGGVGLGLALVRQIAERHGGGARCEPREGGGSRFVISLPAVPPAAV
ncbi:MAG: HAMP domain-containing histidine kinase [Ideonella sp. WA131b]|nr:HAMP domain-containing histidine kinase [Ideonella sp. WA131b]